MKILIFGVDFICESFECKNVYSKEEFLDEIIYKNYDVLIMNFDFLEFFLEVNRYYKGTVIFVTAYIDELIYKKSLEKGDYCYTYEEVWKLPYRLKYIAKKYLNQKSNVFVFKDLVYNLKTKELYKNRENIKLSPSERDILYLLIKHRDRFISKEYIIENSENIDNISSIKVIISKLRKVGFDIENQKNLGYKIKEKK